MRHHALGIIATMLLFLSGPTVQAQDIEPCEIFPGVFGNHGAFINSLLESDGDLDDDGLPDSASLALIEAVACIDTESDLHDATFNAFNMNRAVFDLEVDVEELADFRDAIALLMLISADLQLNLNAALEDILMGTYEIVQCTGSDCTPDPVPEVDASVAVRSLAVVTRATNEPYSATGDLDQDGTNNITEFMNVASQGGLTFDFVVAATTSTLNGTEPIRNPGGASSGGCFIATAAYGTPLANEIYLLRDFRDSTLLTNPAGVAFVDGYYRISPVLADGIAKSPMLRGMAQITLYPVIWLVQNPGLASALIFFMGVLWFTRRRLGVQNQK